MEAKGRKILKVCGVFFVIEGIVGIISNGFMTLILGLGTFLDKTEGGALVTAIATIYLISSIISLIAGVMGIKYASNKSSKCLVWGIINLVLVLAGGIMSYMGQGVTVAHAAYCVATIVIPSFYIAGAYMNNNIE